ncbi:uncharacterized protein LOC109841594 [Asparagus officinalis]|uniref:uncharacterized protein LOC109841594 n=1 Tax=Asparagus officinalis TaxID=4686 RepID=UPI00098DE5B1|nr:uncharacterized protein LOC109841594 [Asparagus officinalis]
MQEKMEFVHKNDTWVLVELPKGRRYAIDELKAQLSKEFEIKDLGEEETTKISSPLKIPQVPCLELPVKEKPPEAITHGSVSEYTTALEKRFVLVDRTDSKEEESVDYDTDTYITDDEELGHGIDTGRSSHFLDIEPEPKVITTTTSMPSPIVEPARDLTTFYFLEEAGLRAEAKPKPKVE